MAKLTKRDKEILELKTKVETKQRELADLKVFRPKTNLVLPFGNNNINLNVLDSNGLLVVLSQVASILPNLAAVGITEAPDLGSYSVEDWIHDIKGKYMLANVRKEETKLKKVEDKLNELLSEDVKKDRAFEELKSSI